MLAILRPRLLIAFLLAAAAIAGAGEPTMTPARAERPREYVDTEPTPSTGRTIHVSPGSNLQGAVNAARLGDVLTLAAGVTYTGPVLLPKKEGSGWLVIRTDAPDARLASGGSRRAGPAMASLMARLVAPAGVVVSLAPGAHHYRFVGIEISPSPGAFITNLVAPAVEPSTDDDQPHHIIFDRCYLHGDPTRGARRAIALNGRHLAVIHSHLSDFKEVGADSQALAGWNGSGPFKIVDNYLEGAGENVMFGGADPRVPDLVPSDIEIRGNTFAKNPRWDPRHRAYDGSRWTMKSLFQLKNARRVLLEANLFQDFPGSAVVVTPRNQSGTAPWSTVEDVTIRYNWMRQVSSVLTISGYDEYHPSQPTRRISVEHNVAESFAETGPPNPKMILVVQGPDDVAIRHNTILTPAGLGSSYLFLANATTKKGNSFAFADNIVHLGTYGLGAEHPPLGKDSATLLDGHFHRWTFANNVLIGLQGSPPAIYPVRQHWATSAVEVGFRDLSRGDFTLSAQSRYRGLASGGDDPGARLEDVRAALGLFMALPGTRREERP